MTRPPVTALGVMMLAAWALMLGGCGDSRRSFGLERTSPDEFAVVSRAPLSLPPDYALKPPRPGAPRPQEAEAAQKAAQTVLGGSSPSIRTGSGGGRGGSKAEQVLLSQAGTAAPSEGDIRAKIDQEATGLVVAEKSWVDSVLFWRKPDPQGTVVDPNKEAQRIRSNTAEGKAVNEGDIPTIERRKRGVLEGLF